MSTPFLTPSVQRLLQLVAAGPQPDPGPEGQRRALEGAMAAFGHPAPANDAARGQPPGSGVITFEPAARSTSRTIIAYLHGGSFVAGGVQPHAGIAQALSNVTGAKVALIDYRLAPEHPLPAGRDDCIEAVSRLADDAPVVLVGDSAGGWLAIETALSLAESSPGSVQRLVLVNPMIGPRNDEVGSLETYATGFFASSGDFADAWRTAGKWAAQRFQPGGHSADLASLPSTVIVSNEADPVRDEAEQFAETLSRAGVNTLLLRARGMVHAAWLFPKVLPEAQLLLEVIGGATGLLGSGRSRMVD